MRGTPSDDIVISGAGAVCAVGTGLDALRAALFEGRDGIREISRFDVDLFKTRVAALWPGWEGRKTQGDVGDSGGFSAAELAVQAAREALDVARLARPDPERVAVVVGTCFGEDFVGFSELAAAVADAVGARGPALTLPTACSSSTAAVGLARDLVAHGRADLVLAGGADVLTREVFAGFHALGALSPGKCTPFGPAAGTTLGEGAGFVVVEAHARARGRGVTPWAHVLGFGLSADAHHETAPDPSGSGLARSLRWALEDAQLPPEAIDLVSAHGTGTWSNDAAESAALRTVFGMRADAIPVSATKSFLGHAQGAAGVLELIAALLCRREDTVPPTLRCHPRRAGVIADPVAADAPRPAHVRQLVKSSAAFGGANAALVLGERPARARVERSARPVEVAGVGAVGPFGHALDALEDAVGTGAELLGPAAKLDLDRLLKVRADRTLDPSTTFLIAATGLALADAGVTVRGPMRERSGLLTGTSRMPEQSVRETNASIKKRGILGVATGPFSRMVLNAPAGACARTFSLRGPLLVLSAGPCSGLLAIACAAEQLAWRDDADLMVAGGHDELCKHSPAEGAAVAVLRGSGAPGASVRLEGWGYAGAGAGHAAVEEALAASPGPVDGALTLGKLEGLPGAVDWSRQLGGLESAASSLLFALAVRRLQRRQARRLLVFARSDRMSCALLLSHPGA